MMHQRRVWTGKQGEKTMMGKELIMASYKLMWNCAENTLWQENESREKQSGLSYCLQELQLVGSIMNRGNRNWRSMLKVGHGRRNS